MKDVRLFAAALLIGLLPGKLAVAQASKIVVGKPEVIEGARARVLAMAVSGDGKLLATGGYDNAGEDSKQHAIRIWDLAKRKQVRLIACDCNDIHELAFSPDTILLAAGDDDGMVVCWQTATGKELFRTPKTDSSVGGIVFRRDRNVLISGSDKYYGWDAATGKALGQQPTHNGWSVECLAIARNGEVIAAGCGLEAVLLNAQTLQALRTFPGHSGGVEAVAISTNNRRIATGCNDGSIKLWEVNRPEPLHTLKTHNDGVNCLALVDEGRRLISGGNDGKLRFWNFDKGVQEETLDASTLAVDALAVTPDEKWLLNSDIIRIQARSLTGDRPAGRAASSSPMPGSASRRSQRELNRLDEWEIVRGDWKQVEARIVGAGNSRINSRRTFPIDLTWRCKLKVHGETNPRIRFDAFHFGYEGRNRTLFLHGPKATGQPLPFEFDREYAVEVQIEEAGTKATLRIDGKQIAESHPKPNPERTISIEAGGKQSMGSCEFYDIEILLPGSKR